MRDRRLARIAAMEKQQAANEQTETMQVDKPTDAAGGVQDMEVDQVGEKPSPPKTKEPIQKTTPPQKDPPKAHPRNEKRSAPRKRHPPTPLVNYSAKRNFS